MIIPSKNLVGSYSIKKGGNLIATVKRYKWLYLLFLPTFIFALLFNYIPIVGVQIAFRNYRFADGIWGSDFVGLKYFIRMFKEPTFLQVMRNTLVISFLKLSIVFPSGIFFALLLNEVVNRMAKKIYQTVSYLPYFLSWVVLAIVIKDLLSLNGPVNTVIKALGGEPQIFLTNSKIFVPIIISTELWQLMGWNSIIFLAAITSIPKELYESADMDGANRLQKAWNITLPSLVPVILILFILRLGQIMNAGFNQIYNLYSPIVYSVGDIIDTYVYRVGLIDMNFSYSTAIGLFKNVIGVILMVTSNRLTRNIGNYGL